MDLRKDRVDWVDYAKGFCIVMVVMMHSTLGVEKAVGATGFMGDLVAFAKPFRMPDFFMISGLFLARVIDRNWRDYLDRKVLHFAYFYVLWLTIQFAFRAPGIAAEEGWAGALEAYAIAYIDPFGTLWFIYLLPVFFVATKLLRHVAPAAVLTVAAALEIAPIHTGWIVLDETASRFVYFYAGYHFAPHIFAFARSVAAQPAVGLVALVAWAFANAFFVFGGMSELPGLGLALGAAGALAVITVSVLLAQLAVAKPLRYAGENSIVIYLAFFLPMAMTRAVLLRLGFEDHVGLVSLAVTIVAVLVPIALHWAVKDTRLRWLFVRPDWAKLQAPQRPVVAAE